MQIEANRQYRSIRTGIVFTVTHVVGGKVYGVNHENDCSFEVPVSSFLTYVEPFTPPQDFREEEEMKAHMKSAGKYLANTPFLSAYEVWVDICDEATSCERATQSAFQAGNVTTASSWTKAAEEWGGLLASFEPHRYTGPNN